MSALRILFVTSCFPPEIGGPARQSLDIINELRAKGHSIHLLTTIPIAASQNSTSIHLSQSKGLKGKVLRLLQIAWAINVVVRQKRPDCIHIQVFGGPLSLLALVLANLYRIPSLSKLTGERSFETAAEKELDPTTLSGRLRLSLLTQSDLLQMRLSAAIWCTTPTFRDKLQSHYRIPRSKLLTIPNFIDLSKFIEVGKLKPETKTIKKIVTVSRLRPWKGLETAIAAMNLLRDLDLELDIFGDGSPEYRDSLQSLISENNLSDTVKLKGPVNPSDAHTCYQTANIFLLPSSYEPFGIVLIEAMAARVPIVASHTGGIPFVLQNGRSGILTQPNDQVSIANAILTLATSPTASIRLVEAGSTRAKDFSLSLGVYRLVQVFRECTNDTRTTV